MSARLVYATRWEHADGVWRVKLLLDGDPGEVTLDRGKIISFRLGKGRFCVGHSRVTRDYSTMDSWKERVPCPTNSLADSGNQCRSCSAGDASGPCARCIGETCSAHPSVREACEQSEAFVYLAVFGDRVKAGVSQGRRVEKRWVEQGADAARRVITGNGCEARIYEKRIQDQLGALKSVKAEEKMAFTDPRELEWGLRKLEEHVEALHRLFPEAKHVDEATAVISSIYGLPQTRIRPIEVKMRDNVAITGKILGAKGPILYLENTGIIYSVNLHALTGRKINEDLSGSSPSQSGLNAYLKR
ncbi:MAG: DUF2797 domain-containing protein [Candidatus Bathyarchaeota archaeon]|nr:DUF2797 domain-containing protein [Candidatus Bathyarchaeota archaeon]